MLLPALVFGSEVKGTGVLKVWWEHYGLVSRFPGQLNTQIPRVEGDKSKFGILWDQVLLSEAVETIDGIAKCTSRTDMFPSERGQAR